MNYFKFLITEKIPFRLIIIVLLFLNMLFNNTNNIYKCKWRDKKA